MSCRSQLAGSRFARGRAAADAPARLPAACFEAVFLIKAAVEYKPHDAVGLDGALARLAHRAYGPLALGVVAAGLIAFALYSLSDARYHRI
jgi:hypothetical protein